MIVEVEPDLWWVPAHVLKGIQTRADALFLRHRARGWTEAAAQDQARRLFTRLVRLWLMQNERDQDLL